MKNVDLYLQKKYVNMRDMVVVGYIIKIKSVIYIYCIINDFIKGNADL